MPRRPSVLPGQALRVIINVTLCYAALTITLVFPQVNSDGQIVEFLVDTTGRSVSTISAVSEEFAGPGPGTRLILGNLVGSYVSYIDLP